MNRSTSIALVAVLMFGAAGCGGDDDDVPPDDTGIDDAGDATVGDTGGRDSTLSDAGDTGARDGDATGGDATIDAADSTDAFDPDGDAGPIEFLDAREVGDAGDGAVPDTAPDTAYDTAYTPPTWSPVCVPVFVPPSPDAGADADPDADGGLGADASADAIDDTSVGGEDAGDPDADDATTEDAGDAFVDDGAVDAIALDAPPDVSDAAACTATRVRIMASNLTSGSSPTYESAGIHILQGLHPDIVMMQEFKYPAGLRALVDTAFDPSFRYVTEIDLGAIPNGIISRYPIIESGEWDDPDLTDRDWVWARIDVPGPIDLFAISTHIRTTSATARDAEAKNLVTYVKTRVPAGVYLVIAGDLNTAVTTEPALIDLSDVVSVSPPYAVDQAGISNTNAPRSKPYDWVLPGPSLLARMIPVSIGTASFPSGLVFDSRVFTPLADVAPVLATDSSATNMQHMGVIRDFALGD